MGRPFCMDSCIDLCMEECDSSVSKTENTRRENIKLRIERSGLDQPDHGNVNRRKELDTQMISLGLPVKALSGVWCSLLVLVHLVKGDSTAHLSCLPPVCLLWPGRKRVRGLGAWLESLSGFEWSLTPRRIKGPFNDREIEGEEELPWDGIEEKRGHAVEQPSPSWQVC